MRGQIFRNYKRESHGLQACCLPGQNLVGSKDTAFDCCGEGHDLAGEKGVGFTCCPTGQKFDGKMCKPCAPEPPVCRNGKTMKDGMCVCPTDSYEKDGVCVPTPPSRPPPAELPVGHVVPPPMEAPAPPQKECSSGIEAGKCCNSN